MKPINPIFKKIFLGILIFITGWSLSFIFHTKEIKIEDKIDTFNNIAQHDRQNEVSLVEERQSSNINNEENIPSYVFEVLDYIERNKKAPEGYVGGRTFKNREGLLPKKDQNGKMFFYQEWDVHKKVKGKNRGAERLVTSNMGNAYYTLDHYQSFIKIK